MARQRRGFGAVRQLPSKRFQSSFVGPDGARHVSPTTYRTKTDAEYWLLDERRYLELVGADAWQTPAARAAAAAPAESPLLREYAAGWIATKLATREIRATTADKYDQALRIRVLPTLGDTTVAALTSRQIAAWWRKLDHDHERACDLAYQVLRTALNAAVADELIETNPCRIKGAGGASARRSIEPLTPTQVQEIAAKMDPAAWGLAVHLGAWCALRSGEVRELRRRDVDLGAKRPVIHVRRAVVRIGTSLSVGPVKTDAGRRDVQIPGPLVPLLREHLEHVAKPGQDGLLIWGSKGQVDDRDFRRAWVRAGKAAGLPGVRFHDLRHVGLTYSAVAGATVRELQQIAGHTTPAMAMRYQEVAAAHLSEVVDRLGAIIGPQSIERGGS